MSTLPVRRTTNPKPKPAFESLGFGKYFSDHIMMAQYSEAEGWHAAEIKPYEPFNLDPAASVLHYGQALFEGMKAFRQESGKCVLFRPEFNWQRMVSGAKRLCMPMPSEEQFVSWIQQLVSVDADWVPAKKGASLYIRPTLIGTEGFLGVRPASEYIFFVILSPVGSYYSEGIAPLKIWIEEDFLRAAPGGLGATKAAANYANSLKAAFLAKQNGYSQVLWLDVERKHVEEVGTMNVFFVFDDEVITPQLDGTILAGGVRDSAITLLKSMNKKVTERKVTIKEIKEGAANGRLKEVFGTGTAAVISPVGELAAKNWKAPIQDGRTGPVAKSLYDTLTGIQYGQLPDKFNWIHKI